MSRRRCCWSPCAEFSRAGSQLCESHALKTYWLMQSEYGEDVPAKAPKSSDVPGIVYYLRVGDRIKIGWTANLEQRLKAYPPGYEILATELGTRADEMAMHQRCTPSRCDGREWYTPTNALLAVVTEARQRDAHRRLAEQQAITADVLSQRPGRVA